MPAKFKLKPYSSQNSGQIDTIYEIWIKAGNSKLRIPPRFIKFNTSPAVGARQSGRIAMVNDSQVGFILVSMLGKPVNDKNQGSIDLIAVLPDYQRNGVGKILIDWAEEWLVDLGCLSIRIGAGCRPFTPGIPTELGCEGFFHKSGFLPETYPYAWDMARSLKNYNSPNSLKPLETCLKPVQQDQFQTLEEMMTDGFSPFWKYELGETLREGGRLDEFLILWAGEIPMGFCQITTEESIRPIERYFMSELPKPWGQMGTFGIVPERRGKGYGAILIDSAARYLQAKGIDGCVIDWTSYLDLYGKFGFKPFRQYLMTRKDLMN